jgi:hypothetical protein
MSKRDFNANDKEDLAEFRFFLKNNKWRTPCPFNLEWPYLSVPEMIKNKIVNAHINKLVKGKA